MYKIYRFKLLIISDSWWLIYNLWSLLVVSRTINSINLRAWSYSAELILSACRGYHSLLLISEIISFVFVLGQIGKRGFGCRVFWRWRPVLWSRLSCADGFGLLRTARVVDVPGSWRGRIAGWLCIRCLDGLRMVVILEVLEIVAISILIWIWPDVARILSESYTLTPYSGVDEPDIYSAS